MNCEESVSSRSARDQIPLPSSSEKVGARLHDNQDRKRKKEVAPETRPVGALRAALGHAQKSRAPEV
jgi:hypothetical protein